MDKILFRKQSCCLRLASNPRMCYSSHCCLALRIRGPLRPSYTSYSCERSCSSSSNGWTSNTRKSSRSSSSSSMRMSIRGSAGRGVTQTATHPTSSQDPDSARQQEQQLPLRSDLVTPSTPPSKVSQLAAVAANVPDAPPPVQAAAAAAGVARNVSDFSLSAQQLRQMVESAMDGSSASASSGPTLSPEDVAAGVCSNLTLGISGEGEGGRRQYTAHHD
jgi:hypothetical protein